MLINTNIIQSCENDATKIDECPICYETKTLTKLDCCKHSFCTDCLVSQENNKCALCRCQFSMNDQMMKERKEKVYESTLRNVCKLPEKCIDKMRSYSKLGNWSPVDNNKALDLFGYNFITKIGFKNYNLRFFGFKSSVNSTKRFLVVDQSNPSIYKFVKI